jgi:hypothetical protein
LLLNGIGLESLSVADIINLNQLVGEDIGCLHKVTVDTKASLVVYVYMCDSGTVNL